MGLKVFVATVKTLGGGGGGLHHNPCESCSTLSDVEYYRITSK